MNEYTINLLRRYKRRGVLVDTNILLVYFVGNHDPGIIPKFKRTCTFSTEDDETIAALLEFFEVRVTTSHILTEISNFIGQLPEKTASDCFDIFSKALDVLEERPLLAQEISANNLVFRKFGLTDTGIALLAKDKYLVLTDDLRVSHYLANTGIDVLNFNHIRELNW
ncbi:MAG: hypothetical protein SF097_26090 [Acidobacteriota bacterium]|nr:hypothetical protein [Acidobacteriota bacterium]